MIIAIGSARGAPGATSLALLLAAAWPAGHGVERVVLEADPSGGVLGARYGLGVDPGDASLLAALRRPGVLRLDVGPHARHLMDGLWAIPGPETATQARSVWSADHGDSLDRLAADDRIWLADVGRFDPGAPTAQLIDEAALAILVTCPRLEDLVQVPDHVARLRQRTYWVAVVVTGSTRYTVEELRDFTRADRIWRMDAPTELFDEVGRALFGRRGRRSWVWRQALEVAHDIAELVGRPVEPHESRVREVSR